MQALIVATSETEGLSPLSENIPTGMLPILNRPMMVGAIEQLAQQGIKHVIVSLYHLPGSFEAYFGNGERWNLSLDYSLQREKWGNAGAVKWAENLLFDRVLVLPADQVFELDIRNLMEWHIARHSQLTIVTHPRGTEVGISVNADGRVTEIYSRDTAPSSVEISTGIFLIEPGVLALIPPRTQFDMVLDLVPQLIERGIAVYKYSLPEFWHSVRSFSEYQSAHWTYLQHLEVRSHINKQPVRPEIPLRARSVARGIWIGRNTLIHPTAQLSPPVFIGENSFVGRDVSLGPEAMLGSNVLVDDGATISQSTVLDNTYVGQFVNVKNSVASAGLLINALTGESIVIVDRFLLGEARSFNTGSIFQRFPDIVLAGLLLIGLFPLLVICAVIALFSTGKIFSKTIQLGTPDLSISPEGSGNALRAIHLVRFSTRSSTGERTPGGQWLEKWEFHRLPELWNVVIGDLRLIGVKSLSVDEGGKIVEKWQEKRNEYPPGFTGLWYLQTQVGSSLDEILIVDAYYVATRTWREDVRILWKTLPAWWKRSTQATQTN